MAKCKPTVDICEVPVLPYTFEKTQTGVTLELSNVEPADIAPKATK